MFINDLFENKNVKEGWDEFKSRAGDVAKKAADNLVSAGTATRDAVGAALDVIPKPFDEKTYQDRVSKPYPKQDTKKTNETSTQDRLHQRHQEIRKQSGKPHPDYYKELRATFDLPDDERWAKTAELKKKYKVAESLRPGERHHFETDPKTGKRVYKGIRGDQQDAPRKRDNSGDAGERADRERQAHIQHDRRMTENGVEETYGAELHTKHKKNRFKQIRKIKQTSRKAHGLSSLDETGCNMTVEGRQCSVHGLAECPGYGMTEGSLSEFAPGSGGGESGRWYTDDQMTDIVGDGWWQDMDVSGANIGVPDSDVPKQYMIQQAQAWLDDQGYSVQVLNCKANSDDDMAWFIEGNFRNPGFAKKGVTEDINEDIERYVEALGRAGYEVTEEKVRLDPKCWKGKKIGSPKTKMKGGVRVNNCVPK